MANSDLPSIIQYFAAFSAGVAAVLAFLDRREKKFKELIERATNEKIKGLEARVAKLETKHQNIRALAVEGITSTADPAARDRFAKIVTVLD